MGRLVKQRSSKSKDISWGWAAFGVWALLVGLYLLSLLIDYFYAQSCCSVPH